MRLSFHHEEFNLKTALYWINIPSIDKRKSLDLIQTIIHLWHITMPEVFQCKHINVSCMRDQDWGGTEGSAIWKLICREVYLWTVACTEAFTQLDCHHMEAHVWITANVQVRPLQKKLQGHCSPIPSNSCERVIHAWNRLYMGKLMISW